MVTWPNGLGRQDLKILFKKIISWFHLCKLVFSLPVNGRTAEEELIGEGFTEIKTVTVTSSLFLVSDAVGNLIEGAT